MSSSQLGFQTCLESSTWRCPPSVPACWNSYPPVTPLLCLPNLLSPTCRAKSSPRAGLGSQLGRGSCRKPDTTSAPSTLVGTEQRKSTKEQFELRHCVTETHKGRTLSSSLPTSPIPSPGRVLLQAAHLQGLETNCRGQTPALSPSRSANLLLEATSTWPIFPAETGEGF